MVMVVVVVLQNCTINCLFEEGLRLAIAWYRPTDRPFVAMHLMCNAAIHRQHVNK